MKADSIIFDLDGTLWDSSEQLAYAWNQILKEQFPNINKTFTRKDIMGVMGMVVSEIAERLFPELNLEDAVQTMNLLCEEECIYLKKTGGNLYDGLEEVLKTLSSRYPLFIVSNCQCGYIECFLEYHKLDRYFKGFLCSGRTGKKKGDNIKCLMERYHLKEPVYVGDTYMDYEATVQANIPFLHASYGFGTVPKGLPALADIRELPAYMKIE